MSRAATMLVMAVLAGCSGAPPASAPTVDFDPGRTSLRPGNSAPLPVQVIHAGKAYTFRIIPEGGPGFTWRPTGETRPDGSSVLEEGLWFLDEVRIGGAATKLEAVAVYLFHCRGLDEVAEIWGDEVVPFDPDTGEYAFAYPDVCPQRTSR